MSVGLEDRNGSTADRVFWDHFGVPRHYPAGSMIFRQGETEDCLYFVREGVALVSVVTPEGRERNVLILLGQITFLDWPPSLRAIPTAHPPWHWWTAWWW